MIEALFKFPDSSLDGFDKLFNVNHWLFQKGNFLSDLDINGKNCANIIMSACSAYNINQRFILMTLQREQELIELEGVVRTTQPDENTMNRATGCGCFDDGTTLSKFAGFENQINCACATYRHWFRVYTPDVIAELVSPDVEPSCICKSAVSYSLIKYTPHIESLRLSEKVYERYFGG